MEKKFLVVGGGSYQSTLISRLAELKNHVFCADINPDSPGFQIASGYRVIDACDKEACLIYAKELNIDAVMTYGATATLGTVAYIAKKMGLPAILEETAEVAKSKYKIKDALFRAGCNIYGNFFELHSAAECGSRHYAYPCVIKPSDGSGSKGVSIVKNEVELSWALKYAFDSTRVGEVYCESYIEGEEFSVETFVCNGEVYIYGIIKTTFDRRFGNDISYGHRTPSGLSDEAEQLITDEVKKAIRALKITMYSVNFDVILSKTDGKPYIIDCGIRIGQNLIASHIIPLSRGVSIIDNTIRTALGETCDPVPKFRKCIATRLLIYEPGTITQIRQFGELIGRNGIISVVMRKSVGDKQCVYKDKSDNCGWVICCGNTPDEAESNAEVAKDILKKYILIE